MELLKLLSANELVAQIISFLILLFLLRLFVWKKVLGLLDARKEKIATDFDAIEKTKQELNQLKADYQAKLSGIEEAANKRIAEAIAQGKNITEEARKKAHLQTQEIIDNAKANIKYELAKAKSELKEEIIDLTMKATEALIRDKLTGQEDEKLIRDFLKSVETNHD